LGRYSPAHDDPSLPADPRWRDHAVFITGANGFVGSWLAAALVRSGARVVALVRDEVQPGGLELQGLDGVVTRVRGDLSDASLLHRAMAEHEVTFCFHLAAQALVGVADRSPVATFATNAMGTVHVLEACRLTGVEHCVIASSDKAYGTAAELPYREDMPLLGEGPYEASKVCTEIIARSFASAYGMRIGIARCANVYGGGDMNFSRLVPDTIRSIIAGRNPVLRSNGSPRRDYLYASDAAGSYLALAAHCLDGVAAGSLEAFNFGWGTPVSALDLVRMLIDASGEVGLEPVIDGAGRPTREIDDQYLDSSRARAVLAWRPEVDLGQGLRLALDWYRRHLAADRPGARTPAGAGVQGGAG
jgi:CDP-glucose 4,6-dehydratase